MPKTVLVTGASTGIGRATALLLDSHGFTVFAGVRRKVDADSLAAEASNRLVPLILDVTKAADIAAAAKSIAAAVGDSGLDGLVNNAGTAAAAPLEFVPVEDFRWQLEVNLVGQLAVTQALIPLLRLAKGRIINVTSIGGLIAGAMLGPYNASKFAFESLTHTLRQELSPWGILAIAIEPGQISTPIWETSSAKSDSMIGANAQAEALYASRIAGARRMASNAAENGLPAIEVAKVIEKALTVKKPRTRYPVGMDAKLGAMLIARLPDRTRDRIFAQRRA
jgi:NAD(P)-dependent dehydrogenase (short-subunit alcohol dehydrogenase family)